MNHQQTPGTPLTFDKLFTLQESIPQAGIERAVEIMRSGKLHRYNVAEGEIAEAAGVNKVALPTISAYPPKFFAPLLRAIASARSFDSGMTATPSTM